MKTKNVPYGQKCKINTKFFFVNRMSQKGGWGGVRPFGTNSQKMSFFFDKPPNCELYFEHKTAFIGRSTTPITFPNIALVVRCWILILMNNFVADVMIYKMLEQSSIQVYQWHGCYMCWWSTSWWLSWWIECSGQALLRCSAIWMICSDIRPCL